MIMKVIIINGPNLNLLKDRNVDIYGNESFDNYYLKLTKQFLNIKIDYYQSNVEGELINKMQEACSGYHYIILNAGDRDSVVRR